MTNYYHLIGTNSRVNVNSTDNSVNVISVTHKEVFAKLREELKASALPSDELDDILRRVDDLEASKDSATFSQRLMNLLQVGANVMTILTPFLPAIAEHGKTLLG
jgi:hypothetical protein